MTREEKIEHNRNREWIKKVKELTAELRKQYSPEKLVELYGAIGYLKVPGYIDLEQ